MSALSTKEVKKVTNLFSRDLIYLNIGDLHVNITLVLYIKLYNSWKERDREREKRET
jgi:hypothetical protein